MIIDGKSLAESILTRLATHSDKLKSIGVTPTLAVILIGDNPASLAYIKQKQKAAEKIGANLLFDHQPDTTGAEYLAKQINTYNGDPKIHGVIVQRPIPASLGDVSAILSQVAPHKDIDGFLPNSPFTVPVAVAVEELLKTVAPPIDFPSWLQSKQVVVIGRGETAGKPIAEYFTKLRTPVSVVHSQTKNTSEIIRSADIIISCVGLARVVTAENMKPGAMLISVGIWRDADGKLHGDYDEREIAGAASHYTPTPGGVGPVNVACLMKNLIKACTMVQGGKTI